MFGQKTAFGSTGSAFGTSTSSLFSQNKPVGVTFGSPQQTGATGGLFGSGTGAPATGSLFGNTAASSAGSSLFGSSFGQQSTAPATGGGLFGSTATSKPSLFGGSTATGGGLFGATTATQAQPGTSLFGSSTGATGGGLFGATQTATSGTTIKFDPPINQDTMMKNNIQQSIQTKHLCITAMKAYEQKSLEELRVEDYLANRKGPAVGATTGFSFGSQPQQQTPATGGLFGQTTQTASAAPSLFGTQQKSLFGSTAAPSSTGGGLFGTSASTQSGGLFGQQKSLFGAPATTSAGFNFSTPFSSTATTSSGGLFGAKPATTGGGLFGATGQSAFGQPQTAGTFGFGQPQAKPATGGLFGASTTPFGAQASTANTGFNLASAAPNTGFGATGGSLFGPKPAVSAFSGFQTQTSSAFGQPTGGLGLFGAAQPKPGTGLFGATAPAGGTTGLFGATGQTQGLGTGLFGGAAKTSTPFSFGPQPGTGGMGTAPSFNLGASMPNMAGAGLTIGTDPAKAAMEQAIMQNQVMGMAASPYRDYPFAKLLGQKKDGSAPSPTDPVAQSRIIQGSSQKQGITSPSFGSRISAKPFFIPKPPPRLMTAFNRSATFSSTTGGGSVGEPKSMIQEGIQLRRNVKRLVIPPKGNPPKKPSPDRQMNASVSFLPENDTVTKRRDGVCSMNSTWTGPDTGARNRDRDVPTLNLDVSTEKALTPAVGGNDRRDQENRGQFAEYSNPVRAPVPRRPIQSDPSAESSSQSVSERLSMTVDPSDVSFMGVGRETDTSRIEKWEPAERHPAGITLTRSDYYTSPTVEELKKLTDSQGECWVEDGFIVGRTNYGSVFWPDSINVAGLDLDAIVHFRHKEVTVYPDDETKPDLGKGLNRPAEVTLERIWPNDKTTHTPIKDVKRLEAMKFRERLEKASSRMEADFIDYRPDSGSWVFKVSHFSKYGLDEESEEDGVVDQGAVGQQNQVQALVQRQKFHISPPKDKVGAPDLLGKPVPFLVQKVSMGLNEDDEDMSDIAQQPVPADFHDTLLLGMDEEDEMFYPSQVSYADLIGSAKKAVEQLKASFFDIDSKDGDGTFPFQHSDSAMEFDQDGKSSVKDLYNRSAKLLGSSSYLDSPETPDQKEVGQKDWASPSTEHLISKRFTRKDLPQVPYADSLLLNRFRLAADAGCFQNRRFRAGWSPDNCLIRIDRGWKAPEYSSTFSGSFLSASTSAGSQGKKLDYGLRLEKLIEECGSRQVNWMTKLLDYQISMSQWDEREPNAPWISPSHSVEMLEGYSSLTKNSVEENMIWRLCLALWGSAEKMCPGYADNEYAVEMARKRKVAAWITDSCRKYVEDSLTEAKEERIHTRKAQKVFLLMTNGDIEEAANEALESGDMRLSLLIAQSGNCPETRCLCLDQLAQWFQCGAEVYVAEERLKQMALIAGKAHWKRSDGKIVNPCRDVDWKRAMGIHLWYACEQEASIYDVIEEYENSWCDYTEAYAPPPLPDYRVTEFQEQNGTENEFKIQETWKVDVSYQLLKLYCNRSWPMERVLNPETYTTDHTDYHLSWHLWCALSSIGYSHMSEERENELHCRYANQLCGAELWQYAAFVLMHINDKDRRILAVKKLLTDKAEKLTDSATEFLAAVKVPYQWIAEAKCLWARVNGNAKKEALFAAEAGSLNYSHKLFLSKVAPSCVVNGDTDTLRQFLELFSERSEDIQAWPVGGQIFEDFLVILLSIEAVKSGEQDLASLEELKPSAISLVSRLPGMDCKTPLQRLCQGEMGKKVCQLLRMILSKEEQKSVGSRITELPMPDDYKLEELQRLVQLCIDFVDKEHEC